MVDMMGMSAFGLTRTTAFVARVIPSLRVCLPVHTTGYFAERTGKKRTIIVLRFGRFSVDTPTSYWNPGLTRV